MQSSAQILEAVLLLDPEEHLDAKESIAQVKELLTKKYTAAVEKEKREQEIIQEGVKSFWRHQDAQLDTFVSLFKQAIKNADNKKALHDQAKNQLQIGINKYIAGTFDQK